MTLLTLRQPLLLAIALMALVDSTAFADEKVISPKPTTNLAVHNRSGYQMTFVIWDDGKNCSARVPQEPPIDINLPEPITITVPAATAIAVGVGVFDMGDKVPVVCDYILSFTLQPTVQYILKYDIHNRRCFGQLFRVNNGTYQMVIPGDKENLQDKTPEFGWDQFEPGCSE